MKSEFQRFKLSLVIVRKTASVLFFLPLLIMLLQGETAYAVLSGCEADTTPNQVYTSSTTDIQFSLQNTAVSTIQWVHIVAPSADFTINNVTVDGWSAVTTGGDATLTAGMLTPGATLYFTVNTTADNTITSGNQWSVQASDDAGGASPATCYGSHGLDIASAPETPPVISNIQLSDLTYSSITISWQTDLATVGQVNYGTTTNYGSQTAIESTPANNHYATVSNLTDNTAYHFQIFADAGGGNTNTSGDNTFLTPERPITSPSTTTSTSPQPQSQPSGQNSSSVGSIPIIVPVSQPTDKIPPHIQLSTLSASVFKAPPTFTGEASDDGLVQRIEYSTDDGQDWLPVDTVPKLGTGQTSFSFTPINLDDGTYKVMARATDGGGNVATTPAVGIVIDRLPPIIGGNIVSIGAQLLTPDATGRLTVPMDMNVRLTTSAVGGPDDVVLSAFQEKTARRPELFHLTKSVDTGLWGGVMDFSQTGVYQLVANATDGAGTQTTRQLNSVQVIAPGYIRESGTNRALQAQVRVFYRDPTTGIWNLWDAAAYDQTNPLTTEGAGGYSFILPAGTYYLRINSPGYQPVVSQSFKLNTLTVVADNFYLHRTFQLHLGPLHLSFAFPVLTATKPVSATQRPTTLQAMSNNRPLPNFSLPLTNGQTLTNSDLFGKPSILTFISTWAPPAQEQLGTLNKLSLPNLNVIPVSEGESEPLLAAYNKIAGYHVPILADNDQQLMSMINLTSLPTHYFIDRHGVVKKIMVGVLSNQELLNNVTY